MIEVFAPAKVNLTLHITGQRDDGYHLLDSLVVFADVGDVVRAEEADKLNLTIGGPEASALPVAADNLVLRAAELVGGNAALHLTKVLPVASGIGGGSADAAATYRAMRELVNDFRPLKEGNVTLLGADVPVCLFSHSARMRGIGERLDFVDVPSLPAVLVNPRVQVSTPAVFARIANTSNPPMGDIPKLGDVRDMAAWLALQRNDMQAPAVALAPAIADALTALDGALLARMSGSGATCFGLYADQSSAIQAAAQVQAAHPDWWVKPCVLAQAGDDIVR